MEIDDTSTKEAPRPLLMITTNDGQDGEDSANVEVDMIERSET